MIKFLKIMAAALLMATTPVSAEIITHSPIMCFETRCTDQYTALQRATEWLESFYVCPSVLCGMVPGNTYQMYVIVYDIEICKEIWYFTAHEVGAYSQWSKDQYGNPIYPRFTFYFWKSHEQDITTGRCDKDPIFPPDPIRPPRGDD